MPSHEEACPEAAAAPRSQGYAGDRAGVAPESRELSWEDVRPVDLLGLEVGYRLVPLVDASQGGDLLARIRGVRRKLTQDLGFLVPPVHIRDNLEFAPSVYRINLAGVPIGEGVIHADPNWPSIPVVSSARSAASIPRTLHSAWKRYGSILPVATMRRRWDTPSWIRAR